MKKMPYSPFQFHKGTIKTMKMVNKAVFVPNFNSIKVRLKPPAFRLNSELAKFQFHKGTIKTLPFITNTALQYISIP